ncbi:tRNA (uridine(34)/cytosine(34)/5-carboxymethylaminomethyluridine(34)-2'-O)-methyltransferase TrmL [Ferroacidibacillus organovorans]|uniref:Putative tRNA (cytidine(34)-2'-O)-methyltransferase n=1 Tax=Ferroacidibacillus organovorans TaxID=1765683 RepID=A0A162T076_9BACL|nr:tRNA (uridine(34)/cytosine(34)/5-carboxymethylaminomethyluridine(34)-2'-O)-methyltransferase TrmL [Ferroacidibacillus organovorans]KYP80323.1 tRNA methyltransferase [Ferroacidibacillus organovorans]OAG93254.1 tRNA methyltransferase [Ferroacidibacillus organovorans]OPG15269.1 tRNA (uridine(34)/cytosine(34)/5-carboxymethylaminomethyluridine(34)-2'-O)-methyltransferase TrmL [Ferroacidibacillus organovorans]
MHIVLFEPQIPPNTGNIARTCAATGTVLHLVKPLGFQIDDAALRRAGLDYWKYVNLTTHESLEEVLAIAQKEGANTYFFTKFGTKTYSDIAYQSQDYLIFGKETTGLPDFVRETYKEQLVRIPMGPVMRSLNLSNTVALALYEALRQQAFPGLT